MMRLLTMQPETENLQIPFEKESPQSSMQSSQKEQ